MTNYSREKLFAVVVGVVMSTTLSGAELERPRVQLVDKFGVNIASGQVTSTLETVKIGGAMGLSHSVSAFANNFNFKRYHGFAEKYYHHAMYLYLSETDPWYAPRTVLRMQDDQDSADFVAYVGSQAQQDFYDLSPPYTYKATGDERHTLTVDPANGDLLWTKPNGTVVKFWRGSTTAKAGTDALQVLAIFLV